jgi:hypothetical protein
MAVGLPGKYIQTRRFFQQVDPTRAFALMLKRMSFACVEVHPEAQRTIES